MPRRRDPALARALGERLRLLRLQRGFTQEALAGAVDVEPASISRFERGGGGLSLPQLAAIAAVMGTGLAELVDEGPVAPAASPGASEWMAIWERLRDDQRSVVFRLVSEIVRALR